MDSLRDLERPGRKGIGRNIKTNLRRDVCNGATFGLFSLPSPTNTSSPNNMDLFAKIVSGFTTVHMSDHKTRVRA